MTIRYDWILIKLMIVPMKKFNFEILKLLILHKVILLISDSNQVLGIIN